LPYTLSEVRGPVSSRVSPPDTPPDVESLPARRPFFRPPVAVTIPQFLPLCSTVPSVPLLYPSYPPCSGSGIPTPSKIPHFRPHTAKSFTPCEVLSFTNALGLCPHGVGRPLPVHDVFSPVDCFPVFPPEISVSLANSPFLSGPDWVFPFQSIPTGPPLLFSLIGNLIAPVVWKEHYLPPPAPVIDGSRRPLVILLFFCMTRNTPYLCFSMALL